MSQTNGRSGRSALRLFEELPGVDDVVWALVTRVASSLAAKRVLFTAPEQRAGTSVLAAATAVGLAQHRRIPVCLIETNFARPSISSYLALPRIGLSDLLDGRVELEDCLQESPDCPGLFVLTAGTTRATIAGEFTSERWLATLAALEKRTRYVILDAAPVLEQVETRLLLRHADVSVLVLRARATRRADAERAHEILVESGVPVLGSIFNAFRPESLFGGDQGANRKFEQALRSVRPPQPRTSTPALSERASTNGGNPMEPADPRAIDPNGAPVSIDGEREFVLSAATNGHSDAEHRRSIDLLERRIAKLMLLLERTESDLRAMASAKNVDVGVASLYRGVQGLSSEEDAQAFKRTLMEEIFQANLELKSAIARRP